MRYVEVVRATFASLRTTKDGEVEIVDLLSDSIRPFTW
jgi:hypothetical protein